MAEYLIDERDLYFIERQIEDEAIQSLLKNTKIAGIYKEKGIYSTGKYQLRLNEVQRQKIIDLLGDLFCQKGLQDNGEPNATGLKTEEMINTKS